MNVLLLSMPDSFEHTPSLTMRMPNGALASLAGNVDRASSRRDRRPRPRAARRCRQTVTRLVATLAAGRRRPVGDDVPAPDRAQGHRARARAPARRAHRRRRLRPEPRARGVRRRRRPASTSSSRGEGDLTFRELVRALEAERERRRHRRPVVSGRATAFVRNPPRPVSHLERRGAAARTGRRACSTATRCSAGRSTSSRRRAGAPTTAASARSSRCAAATSTRGRSSA